MKKQEKSQSLNFLYIDTSNPSETEVVVFDINGGILAQICWSSQFNQTEELLVKLDHLLSKSKVAKNSLGAIFANPGPGSYTGLRVGITTANLIAFTLNKPIFSVKNKLAVLKIIKNFDNRMLFSGFVLPNYLRPPEITSKKPRLR